MGKKKNRKKKGKKGKDFASTISMEKREEKTDQLVTYCLSQPEKEPGRLHYVCNVLRGEKGKGRKTAGPVISSFWSTRVHKEEKKEEKRSRRERKGGGSGLLTSANVSGHP